MIRIAVIGAGLIGRAWSIVFARAGFQVALWDPVASAVPAALDFIAARLPELAAAGLLSDPPEQVRARVHATQSLAEAVSDVIHVQENGPERLPEKQALFAELDRLAPPSAVLASSTSGIPASAFTATLAGRARCLVAHPVNPPYLIPLVELCPAPWTDSDSVTATRTLMNRAGQAPVIVKHEREGFVLNRLQGALLAEAFRLLDQDAISPDDLDATIKHGLGLRWSFMGPLETIDLNAPGGLAEYCARFGGLYTRMQREMTPLDWSEALIARLEAARRAVLPADRLDARTAWRDRRLMALAAHKRGQAE